ncbi:Uncharacterised protein [Serratia fonticola]|uniref:Uncharacterized protein n=1 Tax=Serratia fonticola TaxID=47917 RepID=A0A4U9UG25_SERFO|nr:Uncharacterised protein [Serratia fonticola]
MTCIKPAAPTGDWRFRVPGALLAGYRHGIARRNAFIFGSTAEFLWPGHRETFFKMIPQFANNGRLYAQVGPFSCSKA